MTPGPTRDRDTQQLVDRFAAARVRRRRLRIAAGVAGAALVVAAVAALVLFVHSQQPRAQEAGDTVSGTSLAGLPGSDAAPSVVGSETSTTGASVTTTSSATTTSSSPETQTTSSISESSSTTDTSASTTTTTVPPARKVVVIDPGHQGRANSDREPVGPGSTQTKAKVSSGTAGVATGIPESELVLAVSFKLRDALAAAGVEVVMTRTSQDVDISNIQRALIANEAGADLFVRVHADGSSEAGTSGIHVLYPAVIEGWTDDIASASKKAATIAQRELIAATGAKDRGIDARTDISGFNWADVPVILPEIGFMTNPTEDRLLATPSYQDAIVSGLTQAILEFLGDS